MDPGQDNHVSSSDDIIKDAPVMEKHGEDEDMDEGLGCGLLAKVTTEAYVKALRRDLPAFAAFFPAKSDDSYLMKVSVYDEDHDLLEPALKQDVTEAENRMKGNSYAAEARNETGMVPLVAFVEQVMDTETKSTDLLVMPPYDKPMKKGIRILKKGEFTDLTLLVPECESQTVSKTGSQEEKPPQNNNPDDPLCTPPRRNGGGNDDDNMDIDMPRAPKRRKACGLGKRGKPRKLNFEDCVIHPDPEENEQVNSNFMKVVESSKLIVGPQNSAQPNPPQSSSEDNSLQSLPQSCQQTSSQNREASSQNCQQSASQNCSQEPSSQNTEPENKIEVVELAEQVVIEPEDVQMH